MQKHGTCVLLNGAAVPLSVAILSVFERGTGLDVNAFNLEELLQLVGVEFTRIVHTHYTYPSAFGFGTFHVSHD